MERFSPEDDFTEEDMRNGYPEIMAMFNGDAEPFSPDESMLAAAGYRLVESEPEEKSSQTDEPVDEYGFGFEPEGSFDSSPLQFEEIAATLWDAATESHYAATRYYRHSPSYMMLITQLEKNIKQLGSYCITKTVLEKSGETFPKLDSLSLHELYCMVSFHFRKCAAAYKETQERAEMQDMNLLGWLFRWADLAERLKATEERAQKIRDGKISLEKFTARIDVFKEKEPKPRRDTTGKRVNLIRRAKALPVVKSFTRELEKEHREEIKKAKKKQQELDREAEKIVKEDLFFMPGFSSYASSKPAKSQIFPGFGMDQEQLRTLLTDEARSRGDFEDVERIKKFSVDEMLERYYEIIDQKKFPP